MFLKRLPLLILACIVPVALFGFIKADDDPIKKAVTLLEKWMDVYPQEKVYLHFDKPYYAAGDDVWFKAYVTVGPKHQLSALSGALNVELIDDLDSVKQAIKIPLTAGLGHGDFALSDTLTAGNYRIRAYTNWMHNAGPDYFFDKTIRIGNSANNTVFTRSDYTYTTQNGQPVVKALVCYTNPDGQPYASKEVSYQAQINGKTVERGKGVTDGKGNLQIAFASPGPVQFKRGTIISHIKIDEKNTITKEIPVKAISGNVNVQFFPESGNLVAGLPSKVAFKAVSADGLGKAIKGVVLDNNDRELAQITTQHLGMGIFMLVPEAGKTYKAQVTFEDGSKAVLPLPKVLDQGYVLTVNSTYDADNIAIRITASSALIGSEVSMIAHSGGNVCYAVKSKLESSIVATKIPKDRFPSGIAQFTLFNAAGEALNERIVFINRFDGLKLNISPGQQTFTTRGKMKLDITANTPDDKPAISSLSAAVIDESKVPVNETDETTILSTILLSSDIKGYIEKPNYYFADDNKQAQADLDVLMLTQGYRRFEWKQLLSDPFTALPVYQPEKGIQVSGHVHDGSKPVAGGKVTLFSTAGGTFILDTLTDANGRFSFDNLVFKDSVRFIVQARTDKNKKYVDIDLDRIARPPVSPNVNAPDIDVNIDSVTLSYLQSNRAFLKEQIKAGIGNHNILLKEVTIREKRKPVLETSANLNGPGNADQVIKSDVFETFGCPTLISCLEGRLTGVSFRNGKAYSMRVSSFRDAPMQIIVDGVYVEPDFLSTLNPYDVGSIEVLKSAGYTAIYGSRGGAGVIVINMKRGGEGLNNYSKYSPGVVTYAPKGYYQARAFYSPQYDDPKINTALADARTTVYWNPGIVTDKDGKAAIEFFNAGSKGTYRVVVEGIDNEGRIGHHIYRYKVE